MIDALVTVLMAAWPDISIVQVWVGTIQTKDEGWMMECSPE
jgi:hypothetical protein